LGLLHSMRSKLLLRFVLLGCKGLLPVVLQSMLVDWV